MTTANATDAKCCFHCGFHHAGPCYRIKAIEYYPDGTTKRVEYHNPKPAPTAHISADDLHEIARR